MLLASLFLLLTPLNSARAMSLTDWCQQVTPRLPKVSDRDCRSAQLNASGARSVNGFDLMIRDFPAKTLHGTRRKQAIRILLVGGIHGDEQTAAAVVFKWMAHLQKTSTPDVQWRVAPLLNPDGLLAKKPKRVNAHGVDLNRNFPTPDWDKEASRYWMIKTKSDPRRFPGTAPLSEPESRWVFDTIQNFKPHVIISVHAPFGVLDLDGPAKPPRRFGRLVYNRVGVYPGSLGNYSGMHQAIPVLTIELPHAVKMPVDAEVLRIWQDMQLWIRRHISAQRK